MTETTNNKNTKLQMLALITVVAIITATIPNIGQQLYEQGISFEVIDALRIGSYFIFAATLILTWLIMPGSKVRWVLLVLIPVAYFQLLLSSVTLVTWSIGGFAP